MQALGVNGAVPRTQYEQIAWEGVESSNILRVAFEDMDMLVEFVGSDPDAPTFYGYPGVPLETYELVRDAPSVGNAFNTFIRGTYGFNRYEVAEKAKDALPAGPGMNEVLAWSVRLEELTKLVHAATAEMRAGVAELRGIVDQLKQEGNRGETGEEDAEATEGADRAL
jgi:hypothetical protein